MASIVPSINPCLNASLSRSVLSGGNTWQLLLKLLMSISVRCNWCALTSAVISKPSSFARLIMATLLAADNLPKCAFALVSEIISSALAIAVVSAETGMPLNPSRVATAPSCALPLSLR